MIPLAFRVKYYGSVYQSATVLLVRNPTMRTLSGKWSFIRILAFCGWASSQSFRWSTLDHLHVGPHLVICTRAPPLVICSLTQAWSLARWSTFGLIHADSTLVHLHAGAHKVICTRVPHLVIYTLVPPMVICTLVPTLFICMLVYTWSFARWVHSWSLARWFRPCSFERWSTLGHFHAVPLLVHSSGKCLFWDEGSRLPQQTEGRNSYFSKNIY